MISPKLNLLLGLWSGPTMVGGFYQKALRKVANVWTVGPDVGLRPDVTVDVGAPLQPVLNDLKAKNIDVYVQFYSKPDYFPPDLYQLQIPKIWVLYDLHLHAKELGRSCDLFDLIVVPDSPSAERLKTYGVHHVVVMPFAVDSEIFYRPRKPQMSALSFKHEVGFSGSVKGHPQLRERESLLNSVQEKFQLQVEHRSLTGAQVADFYQQCAIVLNQAVHHDLNMRIMEVLVSGRPLLTPQVPGLEEIIQEGEHALVYRSQADLLEKIQYLLDHPVEREAMAERGQIYALDCHSYDVRARELLAVLEPKLKTWTQGARPSAQLHPHHLMFCQWSYHWFRFPGDALQWLLDQVGLEGFAGLCLKFSLRGVIAVLHLFQRVRKVDYFQQS